MLFTLLGGPRLAGHDQHDRCSFTIEAFGENLALDPGMISYENPIHTSLGKTRLHNTITLGGKDTPTEAAVTGFFSSPLLDYAAVDGTKAYSPDAKRYTRRAVYLRPDHFVILDDMTLTAPAAIAWNLNTAGELSLDGSRVLAKAKNSTLIADFAAPQAVSMDTEVWPCGHPGVKNNHATLTAGPPADTARFLVSLYPVPKNEETAVAATPILRNQDVCGLRIRRGDQEDIVLERRPDASIDSEGIQSDAAIAVVRLRAGKLAGAALIEGAHLRWQGENLLATTQPATCSIEYRDNWAAASVQAPAKTEVTLRSPAGQPFRTALLGDVAGSFKPGILTPTASGCSFAVPEGDGPLAGWWLILDKPGWLNADDSTRAALAETLADGAPMPRGGLPKGTVPDTVSLVFKAGANPLDVNSIETMLNGVRLPGDARTTAAAPDARQVTVTVPVRRLLKPEDLQPAFFTTHRIGVQLRDQGLMRRRLNGQCVFSVLSAIKDNALYLSDLNPIKNFTHTPPTDPMAHGGLIRDKGYATDRITLMGRDYPKGLVTHTETAPDGGYAEVVYDVKAYAAEKKTFRALTGIEDSSGGGSVVFVVYTRTGDGAWQERFRTDTLVNGSTPVDIAVPLEGADQLRLYVTDAGDGIGSDHAVWAMARIE